MERCPGIWLLVFLFVICWGGCSQDPKLANASEFQAKISPEPGTEKKYEEYLLLMDDEQREEFFRLQTDTAKDRFLYIEGIQQKKFLQDNIHTGMPSQKVEAILGTPWKHYDEIDASGKKTQWVYNVFNKYRNIEFMIVFEKDKVVDWKLWLP